MRLEPKEFGFKLKPRGLGASWRRVSNFACMECIMNNMKVEHQKNSVS